MICVNQQESSVGAIDHRDDLFFRQFIVDEDSRAAFHQNRKKPDDPSVSGGADQCDMLSAPVLIGKPGGMRQNIRLEITLCHGCVLFPLFYRRCGNIGAARRLKEISKCLNDSSFFH